MTTTHRLSTAQHLLLCNLIDNRETGLRGSAFSNIVRVLVREGLVRRGASHERNWVVTQAGMEAAARGIGR